ncbi:MAG: GntR family transcriptional regulator [Parvibaculaceae bacterium]
MPRTGGTKVYETLRHKILTLQLAPGAELDELALAKAFGVSRTPLREALIRLSSEQLVQILPNRGSVVAPLTLTDFPRFIEALSLVEAAVNGFAAARRTDTDIAAIAKACALYEAAAGRGDALEMTEANLAFHHSIAAAAHNPQLASIYKMTLAEGTRLSRVSFAYGGNTPETSARRIIEDHRTLSNAIIANDIDQAAQVGRSHAALFQRRIIEFLSENQLGDFRHLPDTSPTTSIEES